MIVRLLIAVMMAVGLMGATMVEGEGPWTDVISQYQWDAEKAERVMMCESSGDSSARNGPYVGLFQVDSVLHRWSVEELLVPEINVAAAFEKWQQEGWGPWPVCGKDVTGLPSSGHGPEERRGNDETAP